MKRIEPTDDLLIQKMDQAYTLFDKTRADILAEIQLNQAIKIKSQEREMKRLIKKSGGKSPRLQQLTAQHQFNQERIKVLDEEMEKVSIHPPVVSEDAWMVHGRVLTPERKGVKGLTIGLGNAKGQWIQELDCTSTNEKGYFKLQHTFTQTELDKLATVDRLDTEALIKAGLITLQQVYVIVSDRTQKVIAKDKDPLEAEPGLIDYREIVLAEDLEIVPPKGGKIEKIVNPKEWRVTGKLVDENGQGLKNMIVRVYDKDSVYDDELGNIQTNEKGEFELKYHVDRFRDIREAKPDLYLKVMDKQGNVLHDSKKAIRFEAGKVENFDIQLKAPAPQETDTQPKSGMENKPSKAHKPNQEKKKKPK